jgi:hypothetical protein
MSKHADNEPIQLGGDYLVEIDMPMTNFTGIPDDQFRSVDENGNPIVETESMDHPLIDFDDLPPWADGAGDGSAQLPTAGANGAVHPPVPPAVPPKSV